MAECRGRHDAARHSPVALERDQRRPHRQPAREVLRAVDRVDDPADRTAVVSLLLAEHGVSGPRGGDALAQRPLDGAVGIRHRRQVGLRLDVQVGGTEARE